MVREIKSSLWDTAEERSLILAPKRLFAGRRISVYGSSDNFIKVSPRDKYGNLIGSLLKYKAEANKFAITFPTVKDANGNTYTNGGPSRAKSASRSLRRALLMP